MLKHSFRGLRLPPFCPAVVFILLAVGAVPLSAQKPSQPPIVYKVRSTSGQLKMTVNTSRIITLDQKIAQAQVNNRDILKLTALSPTEVQVSAQEPGVTQINLWGEDKKIFTIDVIVFGDAQELKMILQMQFPNAALQVVPLSNSVLIGGYVDQPEHVQRIVDIAEEYYPKVLNNMSVSGVQQVLLRVKVYEVSRTKLRTVGFDFAKITGGNVVVSGISGLLSMAQSVSTDATMTFDVFGAGSEFFGVLEALRQDNLLKILAEPTLVTVSGRPAFFNVGGEFPILVPQSLGTVSVEYKKFGTQVDFVPIVLGNGRIRLEVRPRVSEIDPTRSVEVGSTTVPGLRVREVDTGVEMQAGQTLALAGLVQTRVEASNRGIPWLSELPYIGVPFRSVHDERNEIELLILVTPELVDAMDAHEVPQCLPGMRTTRPGDWDLIMRGHLEVPNCCPPCGGDGCNNCRQGPSPVQFDTVPQDRPLLRPEATPTPPPNKTGMRSHGTGGAARMHNPQISTRPQFRPATRGPALPRVPGTAAAAAKTAESPGLVGPVGYDDVE